MATLTVRNPVARLSQAPTPRAPRLTTMEGARLGLWWNKKIGGEVALEWLAGQYEDRFGVTTSKFYGQFPGKPEFVKECAAESTVVIGATADCGSCTSTLIHDLIEIERYGTPAVALVARTFMDDARQTAFVLGMPDLAMVEMPRGLTNLKPAEVLQIARDVEPRVLAALASDAPALRGSDAEAELPSPEPHSFTYEGTDLLAADAAFNADFIHRQLGDGFRLFPPTDEAVAAMLTGTSLPPDEVVAVLEPALGAATVEKIAINAVMAGCAPEHLPVILAAVEAMAAPEFLLRPVAQSTGPHNPLVVVNGPIAKQIGMNAGRGALGPGRSSSVNTVIGRAVRLVLMNIGYAYLDIFDLDTIGTPRKYSMCIAENEDESPWEPYSVEVGFAAGESTVSVFSVESAIETQDLGNSEAEALLRTFAGNAGAIGAASVQHTYLEIMGYHQHNLMLVCPEHAAIIDQDGFDKQAAIEFVYRESFREKKWVMNAVMPHAVRAEKLWANDLGPDEMLPVMDGAEVLHIVVVGGGGGKSQYLTGISTPATRSVTPYLP